MKTIRFGLAGGFSQQNLHAIRSGVFKVLETIGVEIDHGGILGYLGGIKGVRISGRRACFAPDLVEEYLEHIQKENGDYCFLRQGESEWTMRAAYMCLNSYDALTGEIRRATQADLLRAVKLCETLDITGVAPLHPQDLPAPLRQMAMARICIENSRNIGRWICVHNEQEARCVIEMSRAAGRQAPYAAMQITISPLKLNSEVLGIVFRLRNAADFLDGVTVGGGAIPMLGANTPLSAPAAWIQSAAEAVGAFMAVKLIDPRMSAFSSALPFPFDMRQMTAVLGSPEAALSRLLAFQIAEAFFGFQMAGTFASMGLPLDSQSTAERMGNVLMMALVGARVFLDAGMATLDDLFCLEQVVLDREILGWVRRVVEGLEWKGSADDARVAIREGVLEGNCFTQAHTLEHRAFYWAPSLFQYRNIGKILAEKPKNLAGRAREIVDRAISDHSFSLSPDVRREIETIYKRTERALSA